MRILESEFEKLCGRWVKIVMEFDATRVNSVGFRALVWLGGKGWAEKRGVISAPPVEEVF